ncbi:hypothetical protein R1sor_004537 [Riccia sorocarpa]|uniref:DUF4246 domain-containing protein n=1 Tax=Riccia sorocarpa TaxID=122646 RepID=A0ABD3HIZ5_9MARC
MLPRVIKACLYPNGHFGLITGRRRRNKHSIDRYGGDQCLIVPRDSTCGDHGPAIYVKDGLGDWALIQPPPPIPVDAVIDFDKLRTSIGASQAEVRRRIREPLNQKDKGIWFVDNVVPTYLRHLILTRLDAIANAPNKDFHPGTDHMVQDLIHPSLFSYIEGVSPLIDATTCPKRKHPTIQAQSNTHSVSSINSMGREYDRQEEESKYQWLPSQFYVSPKGSVKIKSYVNNLDEAENSDLYKGIELLFELFLPMFENILPGKQLRGRELQVIVKAVNYVIQPKGHMYEGVWHVEGLAQEHILASGLYYYSTSSCLKDGGLEFRPIRRERELNPTPAGEMIDEEDVDYHVFEDIRAYRTDARREPRSNQSRLATLRRREWLRVRSMVGSVPTLENRLLVFPNNLQHKVSGIVNDSENEVGTRKTFMFFLVDPDVDIISTRDVHKQQWDKLRPVQRATLNEVAQNIIGRSLPAEILDEIINRAKRGLTIAEARAHRLQLIKDRHMKFECDNDDYS